MSTLSTPLLAELQAVLAHDIPLTQQMDVTVAEYTNDMIRLTAPLAPNINHKATAFAGSLNAMLTLAGWSMLWLLLLEHDEAAKIVIQSSSVTYHRPVAETIAATCARPDEAAISRCLRALRSHQMGRIDLQCQIVADAHPAVTFTGRYIAHRPNAFAIEP